MLLRHVASLVALLAVNLAKVEARLAGSDAAFLGTGKFVSLFVCLFL